jgi:hypothetical protein
MNQSLFAFADELEKIAQFEKDAGLKEMAKKVREWASRTGDKARDATYKAHIKMTENPRLRNIIESATDPNAPDSTPITQVVAEVGKKLIGN